jgi:hypothetical protein
MGGTRLIWLMELATYWARRSCKPILPLPLPQEENERSLPGLPTRLPPPTSKKWLESVARIETE